MYVTNILSALLAVGATTVSAHGFLKYIDYDGTRYLAWQVGSDEYVTPPDPLRFTRRINTLGPAVDFTSNNITCGEGGNTPTAAIINVQPGTQIKFVWDQWGSSHSGPVMNYIAKCTPNCASFKGDSGPVWVKIDEMAFDANASPQWASDKLATLGASWTVCSSPALKLFGRHRIMALTYIHNSSPSLPTLQMASTSSATKSSVSMSPALPWAHNSTLSALLSRSPAAAACSSPPASPFPAPMTPLTPAYVFIHHLSFALSPSVFFTETPTNGYPTLETDPRRTVARQPRPSRVCCTRRPRLVRRRRAASRRWQRPRHYSHRLGLFRRRCRA